jgi:hypothetical protein
VNMEYFLPWQNFAAIKRDIQNGEYGEIVSKDIGFGNPFLDIAIVAKNLHGDTPPNDPFSGRPIYNKLDTPTDKALAMARWVYEKFAPPMLTDASAIGKTQRAFTGEKDRYGRAVTPGTAAASWVGVNVVSPTRKQVGLERAARLKELRASLIRKVVDPTVPTEEKARAQEEFKRRVAEVVGEY